MTHDDLRVIKYVISSARAFRYWILLRDYRPGKRILGRHGRLEFINYFQALFGPIGQKWYYQKLDKHTYIIRLNSEADLIILLLKFKKD